MKNRTIFAIEKFTYDILFLNLNHNVLERKIRVVNITYALVNNIYRSRYVMKIDLVGPKR